MKQTNYQGFTFIESLYGLIIVVIVLSFFQPFVRYVNLYQNQSENQSMLEWQTFSRQLEYELSKAEIISSSASMIEYRVENKERFIIEKYNNQIRKKTLTVGHQPLLLNVASWHIERIHPQQVYIEIVFLDGTLRSCYQTFEKIYEVIDEEKI